MIDAIGTVMFWAAAAVGAFFALLIGAILLFWICAIPVLIVRELRDIAREIGSDGQTWFAPPRQATPHRIPAGMTPEQRYQWANRIGPYADA